jgi:hypothetical protein
MNNQTKIRRSTFALLVPFMLALYACKSTTPGSSTTTSSSSTTVENKSKGVSASGIIQLQGITTYQYGTHVLLDVNGNTLYALKSDILKLNNYLGKKVELQGMPVEGYPLEGGPDYLEVLTIHE